MALNRSSTETAELVVGTAKKVIADLSEVTAEGTPSLKVYAELMADHPDLALYEVTFYPERWESVVGRDAPGAAESDPEFIARAAEELQQLVREHRGFDAPRCPGHDHPVTPVAAETARWTCPEDPAHFNAVIGEYHQR
ncbi:MULTISPECIES: histidine phosphatase family protein [unclassified Crossiella]|uniref:histidine phosphatase family protein n=1 Tax=unclassified Crossiella TaxID=2620835 RepID=UPI001FFFCCF8|nr:MULTISPECIES: histidine phosphatase family protein [unclassified Crossiella]MCK2237022.1 histidine phosphatase family protein [Crossiella sp. S99.2]MCK2250690.1 histidine phosphatase family protein [Crossiella sp. S99.1]